MTQIPLPIRDPSAGAVLDAMARGAAHVGDIARGADLPVARVVERLREMGARGIVEARGRRWVRL